ncbi:hypothetical protein ACERZ8_03560 [Tateyamaria armeniaca]|uniref:Uncharacterized protein n=1 Tax=Tateyamaria armeniaca TaxID=2518930 RepID=A0ABW8UPD6_9RHOB
MSDEDHVPAPAVLNSLALCELSEYAGCAHHMSFDLAMRRAMVDALAKAAQNAAGRSFAPTTGSVL